MVSMTPFQKKQLDLMRQMEVQALSNPAVTTIVPMQTDYANDPQLCLTCVSFLPKDIATRIQTQILTPLKTIEPDFYYYPIESLHVTIQNIRVINYPLHFGPTEIAKTKKLLSEFVPGYEPFRFELSGTIHMPTSLVVIALVDPAYDQFVRTLRQALIDAGIPDDKKYFTDEIVFANTTVCRYTHAPSQKFLQEVKKLRDEHIGAFTVHEVSLIETNAGVHPSKTKVFGTYRFKNNHS